MHGVLGVVGLLDLGVDSVLVDRRLDRDAVLQAALAHAETFGGDMPLVGGAGGEGTLGGLVLLLGENRGEVQVASLVVRGIGS